MELFQKYAPFLLMGIVMFWMMRKGGCCGGHGDHSHKNQSDKKMFPEKAAIN